MWLVSDFLQLYFVAFCGATAMSLDAISDLCNMELFKVRLRQLHEGEAPEELHNRTYYLYMYA